MQGSNEPYQHYSDARDPLANLTNDVKRSELYDRLEALHLQVITIGNWILIQRATFDIDVRGEPYHSIQVYFNFKTMTYIRRVWGISESRGELETVEDVEDLCIATFNKSMVCSGHIGPEHGEDHLVQVKYPFDRWVSGSCLVRYAQDQIDGIIGICPECSGVDEKSNIRENCMDAEQQEEEVFEPVIKCEEEKYLPPDLPSDLNQPLKPFDEGVYEDDYEDTCEVEESDTKPNVMSNPDVGKNEKSNEGRVVKKKPGKEPKRAPNLTQQDREVARFLLASYNGLKCPTKGGTKLTYEENSTALEAFNVRTGRQLDRYAIQ